MSRDRGVNATAQTSVCKVDMGDGKNIRQCFAFGYSSIVFAANIYGPNSYGTGPHCFPG